MWAWTQGQEGVLLDRRKIISDGVFVNVVDLIDICTRAKEEATKTENLRLKDAADSVMSALVLHLGKRRAYIPEDLRPHYTYLMER
jgi:Ethanolamine utilization protein EutJ (predicted chaperonin)